MNLQERVAALFSKYSAMLSEEKVTLAEATLQGGQVIQTEAEEWAIGVPVFVVNDEGEQIPLPDGEYTLEDGTVFTVAEGVVTEWEMPEAPVEEAKKEEEMSSDSLTREEVQNMILDALKGVEQKLSAIAKAVEEKEAKIEKLGKASTAKVPKAPARKEQAPLNLANLSTAERVAIIQNRFI